MDPRSRAAFLILIVAQAAHSIEEYVFRLFAVFAPARFVSALVSSDSARGFAIVNAALVLFGLWCYWARVRTAHSAARAFAWFWTLLEFGNGTGHILLAMSQGGYFPGVGTAPILLGALPGHQALSHNSTPTSGGRVMMSGLAFARASLGRGAT